VRIKQDNLSTNEVITEAPLFITNEGLPTSRINKNVELFEKDGGLKIRIVEDC
jgi:hypothetical protein